MAAENFTGELPFEPNQPSVEPFVFVWHPSWGEIPKPKPARKKKRKKPSASVRKVARVRKIDPEEEWIKQNERPLPRAPTRRRSCRNRR